MDKLTIMMILTLTMVNFVSATTCNYNQINTNFDVKTPNQITMVCTNPSNASINLTTSGESNYFSISPSLIPSTTPTNVLITFSQNIPVGIHFGFITTDSNTIPMIFNVTQTTITYPVIVFPTASITNIIQNAQKTLNIQVIVPSNYPGGTLTIQSVSTNPNINLIQLGDLSLGQIHAGQTLNIPITIDSTSYQTGTYNTQLNILATDSNGQVQLPSVDLQVVVSASLNPINNQTFVSPTCSLANANLNINQTYILTCSNVNNNIQISPDYSSYYNGVTAGYSSGVYTWTFQPIKIGSTIMSVHFLYQNGQVFAPFTQSITILPNGLNTNGNTLDVAFFQNGQTVDKNSLGLGNVSYLILDKTSQSIISNYQSYLNGEPYNDTHLNIELSKTYDLRIDSLGYNTLDLNISANIIPLSFQITPIKDSYIVGDSLFFNSSTDNVTYLINDLKVSNPATVPLEGINTIKAEKDGYVTSIQNITAIALAQVTNCDPTSNSWKNGNQITCQLSKSTNWSVYNNNNLIQSGNNNLISFKITDVGIWEIRDNGKVISTTTLKKENWYDFIVNNWIISVIVLIIIIVIVGFMISNKNKNPYE